MLEGTEGRAHELKAQGALEAARDPNSSVHPAAAERSVLVNARAGGAAAFQFHPDASPEEKKAQVRDQVREHLQLPNVPNHAKETGLVTDADDGEDAGYDLPAPTAAGAIATVPQETSSTGAVVGSGAEADGGPYSKTGWAPRFGNPGDNESEGTLLDHQDFLESKLDDRFFGDWYHNTGVIIFACLASWTVAMLDGGLGWVFLVMAICGTYYRTSIRRVRRNFRDDIRRQMAKAKLETDSESVEWINSFLTKFWPIYAPVLCAIVISSVDQILSTSTPAFLDSMRMKLFTLGTKPPRLEHVKTYPRAEDDIVIMDWKFSFTPNDTSDLTARQIKNKVNPKIVLEVRVGKAMISTGLDVIVEDMACTGLMRVKLKLQLPFPHIDRIEISFLERPKFEYVCKPIGGNTLGFDINFIPGLEGFIQEQIHANLAPMMYAPNVFPIEVAKILAGSSVDQAIGVLSVTFHGAQGLKNPDKFSGTPDPYAVVAINNREPLGKTQTVHQNANPRWGQTLNVILTSLNEPLTMHVYDFNEYRKDKDLGVATFDCAQLETQHEFEHQEIELMVNGRPRGLVQCSITFSPVLQGITLPDGTQQPPPESTTGIAKFTVEQAKDLDGTKSMIGQLNPYAVLLLNGKEVQVSRKLKRTNNPIWDNAAKELLITDRRGAKLGLVIKDDRGLSGDPVIATYQIKLDDMLDLTTKGQEWYNLAGAKTGRVKMMLQWKPVSLVGSAGGNGYVTPVGVMRFHFQSGRDLRNLDTVGKSDPYTRVLLSGVTKGRTVTWMNNLNPDWDEVVYVAVHSPRENLVVNVMDEESTQKDRTMGHTDIACADYMQQDENGHYLVCDNKHKVLSAALHMANHSPKGTINFTAAFYPTIPVVDPNEEEREQAKNKRISLQTTNSEMKVATEVPPSPSTSTHSTAPPPIPRPERSYTAGTISSIRTAGSVYSPDEVEMRKALAQNESQQTETQDVAKIQVPKLRMGVDDLQDYETGLLIFTIHDGELAHTGSYLEIVMDDNRFPAYTSAKTLTKHHNFNDTAETIVREMETSRITLRLISAAEKKGDDQPVKAKISGNTYDVLRRCLYTPHVISLKDDAGHESRITVSMRFVPLQMTLDPSESFNNQGNLRVEVLDAHNLPSADRNGFSDPYCRFKLDGKEVFKSKVQKRTLNPVWNESFELPIRSRTAAKFEVNVMDWDLADSPDHLGTAHINLDLLEPLQAQELNLTLDGKSGSVRLKMVFKPDFVTRSRQGSSTFSGTFAVPGKVIGAPVKTVGRGVIGAGSLIGRGFKRRTGNGNGAESLADASAMDSRNPSLDNTTLVGSAPSVQHATHANGTSSAALSSVSVNGVPNEPPRTPHGRDGSIASYAQSPPNDSGMVTLTVVNASGFPADGKIEVCILHESPRGVKEVMKTKAVKPKAGDAFYEDEVRTVACNVAAQFKVIVKNHKAFGSQELGDASFSIQDQTAGGDQEVRVGAGTVVIRSYFQAADAASLLAPGDSPVNKRSGFGRFINRRDRSVTPSG